MRQELVSYVKEKTGKQLDPAVFTVVWARRFTEYKRANLIFKDIHRIKRLLEQKQLQLVFAGKFHPKDTWGREIFNQVIKLSKELPGLVVLPGYDLELSGRLKRGSDLWLNTPLRPLEASGTSGMSANFNGSVHMSTFDGWSVEGTYAGFNGYIINGDTGMDNLPMEERHQRDYESMMTQLEHEVLPTFYNHKAAWATLMRNAITTATTYFDSDRMAVEYYTRLYQPASL
jgi:glycogen phosphorylase